MRILASFLVRIRTNAAVAELTGTRMAGAWLELLSRYDPALGDLVHAREPWPRGLAPYTVSSVRPLPLSASELGSHEFRITLLDGRLIGPVVSALSYRGAQFVVQGRGAPLAGICWDPRSVWCGLTTDDDIWHRSSVGREARLLIATPAALRSTRGEDSWPPRASLIIGSMASNWASWTDVPLDASALTRLKRSATVAFRRLERSSVEVKRIRQPGFIGQVLLRAPDDATGRLLQALCGLTFYTGLGAKTAHGMGQARPLDPG